MKKRSIFVSAAIFLAQTSFSYAEPLKSNWNLSDFVAPSVTSTGAVSDPEIGQIVYDAAATGFYGKSASGTWVNFNASALALQIAHFKDLKSSGTDGGGCTSGSWLTRDINTNVDSPTWASLNTNQITLAAGTYRIFATAPGYELGTHKIKLRNITDSADTVLGTASYAAAGTGSFSLSEISGTFTIASSKVFEIQHRCGTTKATTGFGVSSAFGVSELYTSVELQKLN